MQAKGSRGAKIQTCNDMKNNLQKQSQGPKNFKFRYKQKESEEIKKNKNLEGRLLRGRQELY